MTVASLVAAKNAVIFDLFHTLTSADAVSGRGLRSTSELLGVDRLAWSDQLNERSDERLLGVKADPFDIVAEMAWAIDPSLSGERIRLAVENRLARFRSAVLDIPEETVAVLRQLKERGKRLGLISNADAIEIAAWNENSIHSLFDSTVFSCTVGLMKPNREIYELSLRELDVAAAEAVFVGDGGSHELVGARKAGITAVLFAGVIRTLWPERVVESAGEADHVIERLAELVAG